MFLQNTEIPIDELVPKLKAIAGGAGQRLRRTHLCARR